MELADAIKLIRYEKLAQGAGVIWADLGSGSGLFTYALAHLLPAGSAIYAIDQHAIVLTTLPNPKSVIIRQQQANFITDSLHLPILDGILMANSLHYVKDKAALIHKLDKHLNEDAGFLIVEYDTDIANQWVPYPISFIRLKLLFEGMGYSMVTKLQERASLYRRANLYAAYISK